MTDWKLGAIESRFADIIWQNEPLSTQTLVTLCEKELQWKRTTTYTVLKRLSERGLFQNDSGTVTSLISRDDFYARQSEQYVADSFGGSLPAFLNAFSKRKHLTVEEIETLKAMIDRFEKK